ncbi:MAG: Gfo/Idh/MocA family oxidoreductase, partial [Spirochaetia bacterium]|nr:Gfo/Idh/MocA family oxidoreductase [Spirochaetia bacterium]
VAACDPKPDAFKEKMEEWNFKGRKVQVFNDYRMMLMSCQQDLDFVVIPTPIPLHAEMHAYCVQLGLPVYLEKPPTLDAAELEAMILTDKQATRATNVGFNFTVEVPRQTLKKRLLAGEFGKIKMLSLSALWPRPREYYERANWAGKLMLGEQLVLDSPLGNAMAHFVYNLLFWGGENGVLSWVNLTEVKAELYRARKIEGADTFFIEAKSDLGLPLRFALTHAVSGKHRHEERISCEKATISYKVNEGCTVTWTDGRVEKTDFGKLELHLDNLKDYLSFLRGEKDRPLNLLSDARSFVAVNNLAYIAAGQIQNIPQDLLEPFVPVDGKSPNQPDVPVLPDGESWTEPFLEKGTWPSERFSWAKPGQSAAAADLPRLRQVVEKMRTGK